MPSAAVPPSFNAYRTLGLSSHPAHAPSLADIKTAYRRALLTHHPDKAQERDAVDSGRSNGHGTRRARCTVDDITKAYKVLSSPAERAEHDRALRLRSAAAGSGGRAGAGPSSGADGDGEEDGEEWRLGLEVLDLDELEHDGATGVWWRGCRCGMERGFAVDERALERGEEVGEVLVGCGGCSLWVRVCFAVAEDGDGEDEARSGVEGSQERGG